MSPPVPDDRRGALGMGAVVATALLWGLSAVAIKAVSTGGLVTALYRLWFAIPPMLLTLLLPGVRRRLDRRWLQASLVGGLLFSLHQALYFTSLKLTSVTDVTIIGSLQPALVLLFSGPLFGETAAASSIVWSAIAFSGTALVVIGADHAEPSSFVGDALAFLNLFAFTSYFLASKRFRERTHAWDYVVGMTTVSGVVILAVVFATGQDLGDPTPGDWLTLAWLALMPGTLGHVLTNWAHRYVPAFVSSMVLLAVPAISAGAAWLLIGEKIHALQVAGGAVVLLSIAMIVRSSGRREAEVIAEGEAFTDAP